MPCRSDYMEPTGKEQRLQESAQLLYWVMKQRPPYKVPKWLVEAKENMYCSDDRAVIELCSLLRSLPDDELDRYVYNAKDATSRKLADWWEEHLAADRVREKQEAAAKRSAKLRASAASKLTKAERQELGLS